MKKQSISYIIMSVLLLSILPLHSKDAQITPTKKNAKAKSAKKKLDKKAKPADVAAIQPKKDAQIVSVNDLPKDAYLVDKIDAVVFGQEGSQIITKSEVDRPSLEGRPRTLDDIVLERLMYLDGQRFKVTADDEMIDRHLGNIQRDNHMTLEDLKNVFAQAGYSYEEGRRQFGMISVINQVLDFRIRSRLIVPDKEVSAYYKNNPEMLEPCYHVQRALIPYSDAKTRQALLEEVEQFVTQGNGLLEVDWQQGFWVNASDLAENKKFITLMETGAISMPTSTSQGFEIFKLVEKKSERARPYEECYREIAETLKKPRYEQLLDDYKKQLFSESSVLIFS